MTAVALDRRIPGSWAVPLALGLQEGRRIVLHPLALVGLVLTVLPMVVIGDNGPREAFDVLVATSASCWADAATHPVLRGRTVAVHPIRRANGRTNPSL